MCVLSLELRSSLTLFGFSFSTLSRQMLRSFNKCEYLNNFFPSLMSLLHHILFKLISFVKQNTEKMLTVNDQWLRCECMC